MNKGVEKHILDNIADKLVRISEEGEDPAKRLEELSDEELNYLSLIVREYRETGEMPAEALKNYIKKYRKKGGE